MQEVLHGWKTSFLYIEIKTLPSNSLAQFIRPSKKNKENRKKSIWKRIQVSKNIKKRKKIVNVSGIR